MCSTRLSIEQCSNKSGAFWGAPVRESNSTQGAKEPRGNSGRESISQAAREARPDAAAELKRMTARRGLASGKLEVACLGGG